MFAVHTPEELQAVIDRIEAKGRGKPIGEQMLADAHRWGEEKDGHNNPTNLRQRSAAPQLRHLFGSFRVAPATDFLLMAK